MKKLPYQDHVMDDLSSFMQKVNDCNNIIQAWNQYWMGKDIKVGFGGLPPYNNTIPGVPYVCMKVPTGGGKTYMACRSLKRIFSFMPPDKPRMVIWLVPSDSILTQTLGALRDPNHEYRKKLDTDFSGRVGVYTKDELLNGQNFSPDTVRELVTICVLSYASLRINDKSLEVRKVYQQNGNLMRFAEYFNDKELLLADTPETALIQVLRQLTPLVIVDESHNAGSKMSVEMLTRLNPHFILALTATPLKGTNILSYVDARELKKEHMVKLPVVVYNRSSRESVINDAIQLQRRLEEHARAEEEKSGKYIRPIVLFQAQPNIKGKENETYNTIRQKLLDKGIPKEQIAIKTSQLDEIGKINLMNQDCEIRFIITVNALKEGWDCPFAYILASLANKTSRVDVEQILGRVLRQPHQTRFASGFLNNAYVLTCSNDFRQVLDTIVTGLNKAGFSRKDYVAPEPEPVQPKPESGTDATQTDLFSQPIEPEPQPAADTDSTVVDDFSDVSSDNIIDIENHQDNSNVSTMLELAAQQSEQYEEEAAQNDHGFTGGELGDMMNQNGIQAQFQEEIASLKIPQFYYDSMPDLFGDGTTLLEKEHLSEGFTLSNQDAQVNFDLSTGKMYTVDIADEGDAVPKYKKATSSQYKLMQDTLARTAPEKVVERCIIDICGIIGKNNRLTTEDISKYVRRIVGKMSEDQINALNTDRFFYADRIKKKIQTLEEVYQEAQFYKWIDSGKIYCREGYSFPLVITPLDTFDSVPGSLYTAEKNDLNPTEREVLDVIASLPNVRWWHRIIDSNKQAFRLNGHINHYPDFIVRFQSGKIALIEVKGDYLGNDDSRTKLRLGRQWASLAGQQYRYFMVFDKKKLEMNGSYTLEEVVGILKSL